MRQELQNYELLGYHGNKLLSINMMHEFKVYSRSCMRKQFLFKCSVLAVY
jgi:hypothetical protein